MDEVLRAELLRRAERDQAARQAMDWAAVATADAENLPWLKQVLAQSGWPGQSAVGADGAHAAWLLAQHADQDPAFQRQCLDLLTAAAGQGEATQRQVAYLTDRVLVAEGQPQEFGTQATGRPGQWIPRQLRDPDRVDERRAAVALEPLAEYLARLMEVYGPPDAAVTSRPAPQAGRLDASDAEYCGRGHEPSPPAVDDDVPGSPPAQPAKDQPRDRA